MGSEEGEGSAVGGDKGESSFLERFERELSVRWLGVLGVVAIIFAIVYSIVYAVQEGVIGPALQIALGIALGVVMAVGGGHAAKNTAHTQWGWIVSGGGVVIAYFASYAAYGFETYRDAIGAPFWLVLAALSITVVAAAVVSARENQRFLAGEAFLLGYAAAYLARGELDIVGLVYALFLTAGIAIYVMHRRWLELELGGLAGAYLVYAAWEPFDSAVFADATAPVLDVGASIPSASFYAAMSYLALTFLGYTLISVVYLGEDPRDEFERSTLSHTVALVNAAAFLLFSTRAVTAWNDVYVFLPFLAVGLVFLGVTAYAAGGRTTARQAGSHSSDRRVHDLEASSYVAAFSFFAAAFYVDPYLSSFVGVLLVLFFLVFGARTGSVHAAVAAHFLLVAVAFKIVFFDVFEYASTAHEGPFYQAASFSLAFLGLVSYFLYAVARGGSADEFTVVEEHAGEGFRLSTAYSVVGTMAVLGAFFLEFTGYQLSGFWAVFGLLLLAAGLYLRERPFRLQALAVLAVTVVKVFLVDMQGEEIITRVISLGVLGTVLLIAAYGYSRYQESVDDLGNQAVAGSSGDPGDGGDASGGLDSGGSLEGLSSEVGGVDEPGEGDDTGGSAESSSPETPEESGDVVDELGVSSEDSEAGSRGKASGSGSEGMDVVEGSGEGVGGGSTDDEVPRSEAVESDEAAGGVEGDSGGEERTVDSSDKVESGAGFCPSCGEEVMEEDNFCINCGHDLRDR